MDSTNLMGMKLRSWALTIHLDPVVAGHPHSTPPQPTPQDKDEGQIKMPYNLLFQYFYFNFFFQNLVSMAHCSLSYTHCTIHLSCGANTCIYTFHTHTYTHTPFTHMGVLPEGKCRIQIKVWSPGSQPWPLSKVFPLQSAWVFPSSLEDPGIVWVTL